MSSRPASSSTGGGAASAAVPTTPTPAAAAAASASTPKKSPSSAGSKKAGATTAASTKKAPKIKKSVLQEQERLVAEAEQAAALEKARKEAERKKKEDVERTRVSESRAAAECESERLYSQRSFDEGFLAARKADLVRLEAAVYERTSWEKYLECCPLPDVTKESSLNTYLSMWREDDDQQSPMVRYKPLIDGCSTTERVVDLLEEVHAEAREELQLRKSSWVTSFVQLLRNLEQAKIDQLTAQFLARYDEFEDRETRVMNVAHNTPDISFGLWVHNTAKRADGASVREKRIEFPSIGFNLELPAALQKSRTSIRVIRTLFDHTSVQQLGADGAPKNQRRTTISAAAAAAAAAASGDFGGASSSSSSSSSSHNHVEVPEMPSTEKDMRELSRQADELYAAALAAQAEHASSSLLSPAVGGGQLGAAPSAPPPVNFVSVGGIISIEQLVLPPPPKQAKGWLMRDITGLAKGIQVVPYPASSDADGSAGAGVAGAAALTPAALAAQVNNSAAANATAGGASQAPMRVSFLLPSYVFLDDREPHFGWWDARHSLWRQEGVTLTRYEPHQVPSSGSGEDTVAEQGLAGGIVHLSLTLLKPVAIIQPRALDFPYRTWHLRPVHTTTSMMARGVSEQTSVESLLHIYDLTLVGSRFPVSFEIGSDHARLISPVSPVLSELNQSQMLPGILLSRMSRCGINVSPTLSDAAYCRKPWKNLLMTSALHEHLALVAPVFEIEGSPFNSSRLGRKCMVRLRLAKDSLILSLAPAKKIRIETERRIAEEARLASAGSTAGIKIDTSSSSSGDQAQNIKDAEMAAMIAAMESDPVAEKAAQEAREALDAAAQALKIATDATGAGGVAIQPLTPEELAQAHQKRMALGQEWVTVLVELATLEPPAPVALKKKSPSIQLFSQDRRTSSSSSMSSARSSVTSTAATSPVASRPATAAQAPEPAVAPAAPLDAGTVAESIPGGNELLKFTLVRGLGFEGSCDERPLTPESVSHTSLRRCLLAYFLHVTPRELDLPTALDMELDVIPPTPHSLKFMPDRFNQAASTATAAGVGAATGFNSTLTSPLASPSSAAQSAHANGGAWSSTASAAAAISAAAADSLPNPSFLPADMRTLQIQHTIRRMLNLTNVFTFH